MTSLKKIQYYAGMCMLVLGMVLLLRAIQVNTGFSGQLFTFGRTRLTTGMVLIPFIIGVALMFYGLFQVGWLLAVGSLVILVLGTVMNARMTLRSMNLVELVAMLVLLGGGLGLMGRGAEEDKK